MLTASVALLILVSLLLFGAPLFIGAIAAVVFMIAAGGYDPQFLLPYSYERISSMVLMAFPLFTLAGGLMEESGIADYLVDFMSTLTSRVKGGLGGAGVIANAIFGACSTSASAAITSVGHIMIPRLERKGYPRPYATALMTSSAGLAMIIPPSGHMILYGWLTYTPVTALFLGGMIPGIALAILFVAMNRIMVGKFLAADGRQPEKADDAQGKNIGKAIPAVLFPVVILGSIYGGVTSPTEAGGLAIVYSVAVGFLIYRRMTLRGFANAMFDRGVIVGVVLILIFCTMMLGRMFVMEKVPEKICDTLIALSRDKYLIMFLVNIIFIILGMIMDDASTIIIGTSLTFTLSQQMGIHPVQFGAIVCINTALGTITPPVAGLLYLGQRVGGVTFPEIIRPATIFMIFGYLPIVFATTYWPPFSLWLPTLLLGPKIMGFG